MNGGQRKVEDDIDIGIRDQVLRRRVGLLQAVRLGLAARLFHVAPGAGDDVHDIIGLEVIDIDIADIADSDDADIEGFYRWLLPVVGSGYGVRIDA
jgi:hypothetical protein